MKDFPISTWQELQGDLKRFIFRLAKDKALTDDISQEVFIKAYANLDHLRDSENMKAWIYRIAKNSVVDHFRKQLRSIDVRDIEWDEPAGSLNTCAEGCVDGVLKSLPDKYREALQLAEKEGYSQVALSQKLKISYSGAKSRVQRARQMLRERVEEKYSIKTDSHGNVIECVSKEPCTPATDCGCN